MHTMTALYACSEGREGERGRGVGAVITLTSHRKLLSIQSIVPFWRLNRTDAYLVMKKIGARCKRETITCVHQALIPHLYAPI